MSSLDFPSTSVADFYQMDATVPPELPAPVDYTYTTGSAYDPNSTSYDPTLGTGAQPALAVIQKSDPGLSLSGILGGVKATAESLLNTWGNVNQIQDNIANAQLQRTIAQQTTAVNTARTLGALDLAQKQTTAATTIETARLNASVANDLAKVANSSPGAVSAAAAQSKMYLMVGAALIAFYIYKSKA